jgi:hypothetical protein
MNVTDILYPIDDPFADPAEDAPQAERGEIGEGEQ